MVSPTTDRRLGLLGSTALKAPVTVVAMANVTQYGEQTIDGVAVKATNAAGAPDRVLCVAQTDPTQNGVWDVSQTNWTRSLDADGNYDFKSGTMVVVGQGTSNALSAWQLQTADPITPGSTAMTWTRAVWNTIANASFTQPFSGAVARGVSVKIAESISIADFGVDLTGVADSTTALLNAITAASTAKKQLKWNAGTIKITAPIVLTGQFYYIDWVGDSAAGGTTLNYVPAVQPASGTSVFQIQSVTNQPPRIKGITFSNGNTLGESGTNYNNYSKLGLTCFKFSRSFAAPTAYGACAIVEDCVFNAWTDCGIKLIRAAKFSIRRCNFNGASTCMLTSSAFVSGNANRSVAPFLRADSGITPGTNAFNDAGVRILGNDPDIITGATAGDNNSNYSLIEQCLFYTCFIGVDMRCGAAIKQSNNVYEMSWIGIYNPSDNGNADPNNLLVFDGTTMASGYFTTNFLSGKPATNTNRISDCWFESVRYLAYTAKFVTYSTGALGVANASPARPNGNRYVYGQDSFSATNLQSQYVQEVLGEWKPETKKINLSLKGIFELDATNYETVYTSTNLWDDIGFFVGDAKFTPGGAVVPLLGSLDAVNGLRLGAVSADVFTEQWRLTPAGDVCMGVTAAISSAKVSVYKSVANYLAQYQNAEPTNPSGINVSYTAAAPNDTGHAFLSCVDTGGTRLVIRGNGGIANYQANNLNLSDRRLKTDINAATTYLDKMCAIEVVTYKLLDQTDNELTLGAIAQQVQAVAPEFVGTASDPIKGDLLALYAADMQFGTLKALQELKVLHDQVRSDFDAYRAAHP